MTQPDATHARLPSELFSVPLDGTHLLGLHEDGPHREGKPRSETRGGETLNAVVLIREGIPTEAFERLRQFLGCSTSVLAAAVRLAPRTLARRRDAGRLTPAESDRLLRTARLVELAAVVFEGADAAAVWLTTPKHLLDGETPLERTDTTPGGRQVEEVLMAIEFTMPA